MDTYSEDLVRRLIDTFSELASLRIQHTPPRIKSNSEDEEVSYEEVTAEEILNMEGDAIPFLLDPLFPKAGLVGLAGSSDTGKSTFLKQFATAVVKGKKDFLGFPLHVKHKSVIYVSTEDDIHGVKSVLKKQKQKGTRLASMKGLRFIFNTEKVYGQVKKALKNNPADLVIIDAFSDIAPGDVNASHVVRPFLDKFANLSKQHDCLFIFLHHTNKKSENLKPNKNNVSGSQSFEAKMRLLALLVRDPVELNIRHLCFVKGNYVGDDQKTHSYGLIFNDDLTFSYNGERTAFEDLSNSENQVKRKQESEEKKKEAFELRNTMNQTKIADKLGVNKGTITRWFQEEDAKNTNKESEESIINDLRKHLESFIKEQPKFKDLAELKSKYEKGNTEFKNQIRNKFKRHIKSKEKITNEQFLKILGE